MSENKSRSIWDIADEYDNLLSEYFTDSIMHLYFNLIRTELIEIIYQLESPTNLTGYKINRLNNFKKAKFILNRSIKEVFYSFRFKKNRLKIRTSELIFFIEYENHYKQYLGLKSQLEEQSDDYKVIFLNIEVYLKYKKNVNSSHYIGEFFTNSSSIKSVFKLIYINSKIFFNSKIRNISNKNIKKVKLELLFFNSKFLLQNFKISYALNKILSTKIKRAIFFKAEGFKIRNIIDVCTKKGIDTIAIQHGLIVKNIKYNNLNINRYFVWSDVFANILDACNASCNTSSLGCPDYDKHIKSRFENQLSNKDNITKLLFLPNSGKSQTPESEILFALKICLKHLSKNSDFQLVIKPHPGGDIQLIKNVVGSFDICDVIVLEKEHKLNYNIYDIVVTMNSTVGIEAAIFRKPLIVILSSLKMMMINDYMNYKIAEFVTSDDEMEEAVTKIKGSYEMYQERCDIFINDYLKNIGTAAKQIVKNLLADV
tara:strand:+ start:2283 stop:3734 length:1452 start_codon:yes stop_codon:yes gene_type:complete